MKKAEWKEGGGDDGFGKGKTWDVRAVVRREWWPGFWEDASRLRTTPDDRSIDGALPTLSSRELENHCFELRWLFSTYTTVFFGVGRSPMGRDAFEEQPHRPREFMQKNMFNSNVWCRRELTTLDYLG